MRTENLYQNLNIRKNNFYPTGAEVPKRSAIVTNITKEYFRLLEELKFEEAEKLRQKQLPPKLYKFVSERELGMVAESSAPYGKKQ